MARTEVWLRLTTESQQRASMLAEKVGARSGFTLVFMLMNGHLANLEGRLDDDGKAMLRALTDELLGPEQAQVGPG